VVRAELEEIAPWGSRRFQAFLHEVMLDADFDGTLSETVQDPGRSRALPGRRRVDDALSRREESRRHRAVARRASRLSRWAGVRLGRAKRRLRRQTPARSVRSTQFKAEAAKLPPLAVNLGVDPTQAGQHDRPFRKRAEDHEAEEAMALMRR